MEKKEKGGVGGVSVIHVIIPFMLSEYIKPVVKFSKMIKIPCPEMLLEKEIVHLRKYFKQAGVAEEAKSETPFQKVSRHVNLLPVDGNLLTKELHLPIL